MYYLTSIDMCHNRELESELSHFFQRIRAIKRRLREERSSLALNRMQRIRCKENLLRFETLENQFYAITYREDVKALYRQVHRYVKLDHERLMHTFGYELPVRRSLFL